MNNEITPQQEKWMFAGMLGSYGVILEQEMDKSVSIVSIAA